jgi:uncharacterized protein DUF6429
MDYDRDKVDEMTLALLWLTSFKDPAGVRAWKGQDCDTMERLHTKGFISDPKSKAKSVVLSEEGKERSKELFAKHFALNARSHEQPRGGRNPPDSGYGRIGDNPLGTSKPSPNRPNDSAVYVNRGSVNLISFPELSFTRKSRFPHGLSVIPWDS